MASERAHKVALIGVEAGSDKDESKRWDCISWNALPSSINLHDYDTWVLFLPTFPGRLDKHTLFSLFTIDYVY